MGDGEIGGGWRDLVKFVLLSFDVPVSVVENSFELLSLSVWSVVLLFYNGVWPEATLFCVLMATLVGNRGRCWCFDRGESISDVALNLLAIFMGNRPRSVYDSNGRIAVNPVSVTL